jgi:hypothetical protein
MKISISLTCLTIIASLGSVPLHAMADDLSPEMKEYTASIFADSQKMMSEFQDFTKKFPVQSAYFVALFAKGSCGNPAPSPKLKTVAADDVFLKTTEGQKVFVVMGAVSTMSYPTPEQKEGFCSAARNLVNVAEREASTRP